MSILKMFEVKVERPHTRSRYYQGTPNTRGIYASRLNEVTGLEKCFFCSPQLPVCLCGYSRQRQINRLRTELTSRGKRPCLSKSEVPVTSTARTHRVDVKNQVSARAAQKRPRRPCTLAGKSTSILRNKAVRIDRYNLRPRHSSVAHRYRLRSQENSDVEGESEGMGQHDVAAVMAGGKDMRGSVECSRPVTHVERDVNSCIERTPVHAAISNQRGHKPCHESARRAVKSSYCALCGEFRYTPPKRMNQILLQAKSRSPGPDQSKVRVKAKRTNSIDKKLTVCTGKYPKVKLCNLAKVYDVSVQDFCCVLPVGLTTKVVHCFKRDLGTEVLLGPCYPGREIHGSEQADNFCRNSKPQRLTVRQQALTGAHMVVAATANPTASLSLEGRTSEDHTNRSASLLLGKRTSRAGRLDRDVEEDRGAGNDLIATEKRGAKRMRLDRSGGVATASLASDQEGASITDLAGHYGITMTVAGGLGVESVMSSDSQSCLDTGISYSDASDTPVRTRGSGRQDGGQRKDPGGSDRSQEWSESGLSSLSPDENRIRHHSGGESEDLFSCQRVTPYVKLLQLSCARTCISWPFPKRDPPSVMYDGNETPSAGPVEWSTDTVNRAQGSRNGYSSVSTERTTVIPTHRATCTYTTPSMSHYRSPQRNGNEKKKSDVTEGGEEEGDLNNIAKGGEKRAFSPFTDRTSKATSSFPPVQEPLACSTLPQTDTPSPTKDLRGTDMDTVSILSPDPASTPSAVGLSDTDTATASSPMRFSSTSDNTRGLSPALSSLSPSSNKDLTRGRVTTSIPSLPFSSPTSEHRDVADVALGDLNPSGDYSDTGSIESSSPPSSLQSQGGSLHSSKSFLFLPEVKRDPLREWGTEDKVVNHFPHRAFCSLQERELHEDHLIGGPTTIECGQGSSLPTKPREGGPEMDADVTVPTPPHPPGASTPTLSTTSVPLQTQSYSDEEEGIMEDHDEDEYGEPQPSSSGGQCQESGSPRHGEEAGSPVGEPRAKVLDERAAYDQDILVVSVIQDDPELFGNLPDNSLLVLGPTRGVRAPGARNTREVITPSSRSGGPLCATTKRLTTGAKTNRRKLITFNEEGCGQSLRTQSSSHPSLMENNSWVNYGLDTEVELDSNNNRVDKEPSERTLDIQTLFFTKSTLPALMDYTGAASRSKDPSGDIRHATQKSSQYCRFYFNERVSCLYKNCWFLHLPREGDEKFCVYTVLRFSNSQNLVALQRAVAVFTGYYQSNAPGAYFTPHVLTSLLSALLRAGFVSDIIPVINVCAAHKILPPPDFLPAVFDYVKEKGLHALMPELRQLTSKISMGAGSVHCSEQMSASPVDNQVLHSLEFYHKTPQMDAPIPASAPLGSPSINTPMMAEDQATPEVERCTKQEDWSRMGALFLSVCRSHKGVSELQHFSGCVAIALLSETKNRLVLPFAIFSETVCKENCVEGVAKAFLGRIGVSLMCRYHKTQQWAKGRQVVEVLSRLKVNYSTLKGLFGNEDGASRCHLVTVAAELFLHSGSVEGSLKTLQENTWFLTSNVWPCEPGDMVERSNMLVRLAKKTSHRDRLEVLTNLPGLKEPTDMADVSQYVGLFNTHLHVCLERQTLTVASDTLDFMLSKVLAVEPPLLPKLLHKLGKMNLWQRARALFKRAMCVGYYPGVSALPGSLVLTVSCLGEIELALAFELFITVNAAAILNTTDKTASLNITLKRTCDSESEYLLAGSRLLSAAVIPKPKLTVRYQEVNSSQEQVFTLHTLSAQRWLRQNCSWANKLWTHSP